MWLWLIDERCAKGNGGSSEREVRVSSLLRDVNWIFGFELSLTRRLRVNSFTIFDLFLFFHSVERSFSGMKQESYFELVSRSKLFDSF